MSIAGDLEFGHEDRERIYEYVESHGAVTRDEVEDALRVDPAGVRHHLAILRRDGLLVEAEGRLRLAVDGGEEEEHRGPDVAFTVRPARQEDLSGIVGAIRQVAREGSYIEAESVAQEVDHDQALLRHNELESRMFFVACVGGDVVGWVHLSIPELDKLDHAARLTVGVLEEYRGEGVGSQLLARATAWAADRGVERLYNNVPAANERAIAFLEGHGWEVEAVREDHYRMNGDYVDEVMMANRL
jgi:ribosomal protein S18 acetylase RimI-like enzyme